METYFVAGLQHALSMLAGGEFAINNIHAEGYDEHLANIYCSDFTSHYSRWILGCQLWR